MTLSLMLTRHLLVVGASFSDDNLLRLLFEVKELLPRSEPRHEIGTVLTVIPDEARRSIFAGDFDFRAVTEQAEVDTVATRALEIELDRVGMFACLDASYLASPDFTGMLNADEQLVAERIRALAASIDGLTGAERRVDGWRLVREALEQFGVARSEGRTP